MAATAIRLKEARPGLLHRRRGASREVDAEGTRRIVEAAEKDEHLESDPAGKNQIYIINKTA